MDRRRAFSSKLKEVETDGVKEKWPEPTDIEVGISSSEGEECRGLGEGPGETRDRRELLKLMEGDWLCNGLAMGRNVFSLWIFHRGDPMGEVRELETRGERMLFAKEVDTESWFVEVRPREKLELTELELQRLLLLLRKRMGDEVSGVGRAGSKERCLN